MIMCLLILMIYRLFNWSVGLIVVIHCILLAALYIPYMSRDYHSQNLNVV